MKWPSLRRRSTVPTTSAEEPSEAQGGHRRASQHLESLDLRIREASASSDASEWAWIDLGAFSLDGANASTTAPRRSEVGPPGRPFAAANLAYRGFDRQFEDSSSPRRARTPPPSRDREAGRRQSVGPPVPSCPRLCHNPSKRTFDPSCPHQTTTVLVRCRPSLRSSPPPPLTPAAAPSLPSSPPPVLSTQPAPTSNKPPRPAPPAPLVAVKVGVALDSSGRRVLTNRKRMSRDPHQSFVPTPVRRVKHSHGVGDGEDEEKSVAREWVGLDVNFAAGGAAPSFTPPRGSPPLPPYTQTRSAPTSYRIIDLHAHRRSAAEAGFRSPRPSQPSQHRPRTPSLRRQPETSNLRRQSLPAYSACVPQREKTGHGVPATWSPGRRSLDLGESPMRCRGSLRVSFTVTLTKSNLMIVLPPDRQPRPRGLVAWIVWRSSRFVNSFLWRCKSSKACDAYTWLISPQVECRVPRMIPEIQIRVAASWPGSTRVACCIPPKVTT